VHYLNNVSVGVGAVLKPAGLEKSVGLITTNYIKDPTDPQWKTDAGMQAWTAFMKKYYPEGDLIDNANVYGYGVARTLVQTIKQAGNDLTRANIMKQAANLKNFENDVLLPGIKINTSATDFAPIESVQLARFDGTTWARFGEVMGK
jgi:branched-chain amino acid transport system substrate-binding protein